MTMEFVYGQQILNLPYLSDETLRALSESELKLLVSLFTHRDGRKAGEAVGLTEGEADAALASLEQRGLIRRGGEEAAEKPTRLKPADETPHYTGEDIERIFTEKSSMRLLIDECSRIVGKMLNPLETNKIVTMSDYLCLSDEYILLLFQHCVARGKRSIAYIEKTAFNLVNEDCTTLAGLEAYIRKKEELRSMEGRIRRLLGCGERALTAKEKEYFSKWGGEDSWHFDFTMIELAYEATIDTIGKKSLPYTDRILDNWKKNGIQSPEDVAREAAAHKQSFEQKQSGKAPSFDTDDFFSAALKRSYAAIEKENEKNT